MISPEGHIQWAPAPIEVTNVADEHSQGAPTAAQRTPYPMPPNKESRERDSLDLEEKKSWDNKAILTIDGGGVRGYSSLLILKALMQEIERIEQSKVPGPAFSSADSEYARTTDPAKVYRPCHYFDYIAGGGIAGLVAMLLGRDRKTVDEAMAEYRAICANFLREGSLSARFGRKGHISRAKVDWLGRWMISRKAALPSPGEIDPKLLSHPKRCRTIAYAIDFESEHGIQDPICHRSYDPLGKLDRQFCMSESAMATVGHRPIGRPITMLDIYDDAHYNNPSWEVLEEVKSLAIGPHERVEFLVSIGGANCEKDAGKYDHNSQSGDQARKSIHSSQVHERISKSKSLDYHRLDVFTGLRGLPLNEWLPKTTGEKTIRRIEVATNEYLQRHNLPSGKGVMAEIQAIAESLVQKRRLRARTEQWERWATGVIYRCPVPECADWDLRFEYRGDLFWQHLAPVHNEMLSGSVHGDRVNALLDLGRTVEPPSKRLNEETEDDTGSI